MQIREQKYLQFFLKLFISTPINCYSIEVQMFSYVHVLTFLCISACADAIPHCNICHYEYGCYNCDKEYGLDEEKQCVGKSSRPITHVAY